MERLAIMDGERILLSKAARFHIDNEYSIVMDEGVYEIIKDEGVKCEIL
ncbi:hypothetical protein [uncultured Photobacterium sp.]|nr:hypothetical protein [uncultured Photobacterium sp.]